MTQTDDRPQPGDAAPPGSGSDEPELESSQLSEAERVFCEFVRSTEQLDTPAFEELCAARPELEADLRRIHFNWSRVAPLLEHLQGGPTFGERLRRRYGSDIDPGISLDDRDVSHLPTTSGSSAGRLVAKIAGSPTVQRYDVRNEVARGGMGAIYRIWDKDLRRTLAMKVMLQGGATDTSAIDERVLGRFLEEAQITGQLDHPGIVPVHDLGLDARGRVYFTMRFVRGVDLKEVLERSRDGDESWSQFRVLEVILRICEACAFAHSKGVVHRDLKPANIMVGRFGETYVMDWGLAKVLGRIDEEQTRIRSSKDISLSIVRTDRGDESPDSPLVTLDGDVVGTPSYMSPEQAMGKLEEVGARSDLYSVGSILYQLLSGQVPYVTPGARVSPHTVLGRLLEGPPTPIQQLNPNISDELVAICDKTMRREPEARYASMMELADDIRAFLEGRVVQAHDTSAIAEFKKWVSRNKGQATASAAAVLIAILGLTAVLFIQVRARNDIEDKMEELAVANLQLEDAKTSVEALAESEREAAQESRVQAQLAATNEELARRRSYVNQLTSVDYSLRVNEFGEAKELLAECEERYRGWEWKNLALRADTSLSTMTFYPRRARLATFTPDGTRILAGSSESFFDFCDGTTGETLVRIDATTNVQQPSTGFAGGGELAHAWSAVSPDRRFAAAWGQVSASLVPRPGGPVGSALLVWDLESGEAPAARSLVNVELTDVDPGLSGGVPRLGTFLPGALAVAPGTGTIAIGVLDRVYFFDGAEREIIGRIDGLTVPDPPVAVVGRESTPIHIRALAYSDDGSRLAVGLQDHTIRVFATESGEEVVRLPGHDEAITAFDFHPSLPRLASASHDLTARVWDLDDGDLVTTLVGHAGGVVSVAFDQDGSQFLLTGGEDNTARVWNADTGQETTTLRGHEGAVISVGFGPLGSHIVTASEDATVKVWDPEVTRAHTEMNVLLDREMFRTEGNTAAVFSPDGSQVVSGTSAGSVWRWESNTGMPMSRLDGPGHWISAIAASPDGSFIAAGSNDEIWIWDGQSEAHRHRLEGHSRRITDLAFLPDGRLVSSALDETLAVWNPVTGERLRTYEGHRQDVRGLDVSPDGKLVASFGSRRELHLWDPDTGELVQELSALANTANSRISSIAFHPDGKSLATGLRDGTIVVWDIASGSELLRRTGAFGSINRIEYHPDESRIFTGTAEGVVQIWDAAWGEPLLDFQAHGRGITTLMFGPDGARLLTSMMSQGARGADEPPRVWETSSPAERRTAIRTAKTIRELVEPLVEELFEEVLFAEHVQRRLAMQGDLSQAERLAAMRLANLRGDDPEFLMRAGEQRLRPNPSGDGPQKSLEIARRVIELEPDNLRGSVLLGMAHYHLGQYAQAVASLDATIAEGEGRLNVIATKPETLLAQLYRRVAHYRNERGAEPVEADFLSETCGWLLDQEERWLRPRHYLLAEDLAREAAEVDPDNPAHRVQVGVLLYRRAAYAEALEVLSQAEAELTASDEQPEQLYQAHAFILLCDYQLGNVERSAEVTTLLQRGVRALATSDAVLELFGDVGEALTSSFQLPFGSNSAKANDVDPSEDTSDTQQELSEQP